ncbi:MAG TPA: DUF3147 family protein [Gaiellaceae bacterium]
MRASDVVVRFVAGAATSLFSALLGVFVSVRAAGVLLAFPAILVAGLTLLESKEGERPAREFSHGAVLGAIALASFAAVTAASIEEAAAPLALALAFAAWVAVALVAYGLLALRTRARGG